MFIILVVVTGSSTSRRNNIDVAETCRKTVCNVRATDDDNPPNFVGVRGCLKRRSDLLKRARRIATKGDNPAIHAVTPRKFLSNRNRIRFRHVYRTVYPRVLSNTDSQWQPV